MPKVRDPVCGMIIDSETAIKRKIGDRTYFFCAESCAAVYEAPERELRQMKRRIAITLLGAVAAGAVRIIFIFGLMGGIMALNIFGGLTVYSLA